MPVVTIRLDKLYGLLGRRIGLDELVERLASLGLSVEEVGQGLVKVEYNPNRPDYSSTYGVARALSGLLGTSRGLPRYRLLNQRVTVHVGPPVQSVRPSIACAIVRNVRLWSDDLEEFISMQEDLHWVLGRNRRVVAIGLHNLSPIKPPFRYTAVGGDEVRFIPLKAVDEMTPLEIVRDHEIGRKYAHLISHLFPILLDSDGRVFSMPPVINARITELKPGTHDIFIDVTGLDHGKVSQTLNILATAFADAGGAVEKVSVEYPHARRTYPDLRAVRMELDTKYVNSLLGLQLSPSDMKRLLEMSRMEARVIRKSRISVKYPPYRTDILHPVDLVEEIAIAYGYSNMEPALPVEVTYGSLLPSTEFLEKVAEIMTGLGFTEVMNLLLTNEEAEYSSLGEPETPHIGLANPATREYTMLRTSILPSLLHNLASNQKNLYPQRIFEAGVVVMPSAETPERSVKRRRLAAATCHAEADYTEIRQAADEVLRLLAVEARYLPISRPVFIEGRCASVVLDGVSVGYLGEVAPPVLERLGIGMPTAALELDLDEIAAGDKHLKPPSE
ncbi:MAG: phenylalanine--tRNA ligase subunit beta [Nitrososphaerota archaeon]